MHMPGVAEKSRRKASYPKPPSLGAPEKPLDGEASRKGENLVAKLRRPNTGVTGVGGELRRQVEVGKWKTVRLENSD